LTTGNVCAVFLLWTNDWRYEAIALPGHSLDEPWSLGVVLQSLTQLSDGAPDTVVGVEENVFAPNAGDDFVASDSLAPVFDQHNQDLQRDTFQLDQTTAAAQPPDAYVKLEVVAEPDRFLRSN
jgi:hypothetical protein